MRCYRRLICISYKDHITNAEVRKIVTNAVEYHEDILTPIKRWKLKKYGHIIKSTDLVKTILQCGKRKRGRQRKIWEDITEWIGKASSDNLRSVEDSEKWRGLVS